jgi:hypothetical protein
MNNLIDFHGATHGHFVEYIINTWIYQGPRVDNAFTELGTCHNPRQDANYCKNLQIWCNHFTELSKERPYLSTPVKIVRITVDTQEGKIIHMINNMYRVADITLERSYQKIPLNVRSSPSRLRNDWYSKLTDRENQYRLDYAWRFPEVLAFEFAMESLYDATALYRTMQECAAYLEQRFIPDVKFYETWQQFITLNQGVQMFNKCKHLVESTLAKHSIDFDSIAPEQALINAMLGQTVGIFDGVLFANDQYPTNTLELWDLVLNHLDVFDQKF